MSANTLVEETSLLDQAIERLSAELGPGVTVERSNRVVPALTPGEQAQRVDDLIDIRAENGYAATLAVEARRSVTPRDAERMLLGQLDMLARLANVRFLVVAPWLSPRTRELLASRGVNYVDLTGNTFIRLDNPTIRIRTDGAARDPAPAARGLARLRGPKAGRLVRVVADVSPPYGVREIATKATLTPGYVSRLLDALDREALVERDDRGRVTSVDIARLLRRYAESYDTLDTNQRSLFVARTGAAQAAARLGDLPARTAITGSFAAQRLNPVAAPSLLAVYCTDVAATARALGLLPADEGANVALLRPFDPVVWDRTVSEDGLTYVSPTQVALDCLAGNGRMPAEGQAVLTWLAANESAWRAPSLANVSPFGVGAA
ncbi:MAG: type IV toxin-antitoxin system AbiEi family antitoxin [Mycobacteriales bacterium]